MARPPSKTKSQKMKATEIIKPEKSRESKGAVKALLVEKGYKGISDFCRQKGVDIRLTYAVINGMTGGPGSNGEAIYGLLAAAIGQEQLEKIRSINKNANLIKRIIKEKKRSLVRRFNLALCASGMTRRQFRESHGLGVDLLAAVLHGKYSGTTPETARALQLVRETIERHETSDIRPKTLLRALKLRAVASGRKMRSVSKEFGVDLHIVSRAEAGAPVGRGALARYNAAARANRLPPVLLTPPANLLEFLHDHNYQGSVIARMLGGSHESIGPLCRGRNNKAPWFVGRLISIVCGLTGATAEVVAKFVQPPPAELPKLTDAQINYAADARKHYASWIKTDRELSEKLQAAGFATLDDFARKQGLTVGPFLAALNSGGQTTTVKNSLPARELLVKQFGREFVSYLQSERLLYPESERPTVGRTAPATTLPERRTKIRAAF